MFPDHEAVTDSEIGMLRDLEGCFKRLSPKERWGSGSGGGLRTLKVGDLQKWSEKPYGEAITEEARSRGAYWAIRLQAVVVGWMLYTRGGTGLMESVCMEMGDFGATLDKWWEGVGEHGDIWQG